MTAPAIEAMAGRHLDAVRVIDDLSFSEPWSVAHWRRELSSEGRRYLVLREGGSVVAHAGTLLLLDELHVVTVACHPDHRGQGHATRLVAALLQAGAADGAAAATLEVRAAARSTQRLYGRFGFAPAGVRPRYYSQPTDDAVIMWLHDLQDPAVAARIRRVAAELDIARETTA